ncbi:MAG: DNA polymerase ligase N-terminal domain-containing protein [Planctomycetota bacterium]
MEINNTLNRYVIQKHYTQPLHYDLMLEKEGFLETYSIFQEPDFQSFTPFQSFNQIRIQKIHPHRLQYLTYEGPISGNRGVVEIWDSGEYSWDRCSEKLTLKGKKLSAVFSLVPENEANFFWLTFLENYFEEKSSEKK